MLIPKIEQRIGQYLNFLEKNAYKKIADLEFEVFEAGETFRSPPENVEWKKITIPAPWGKEWTCFWFRTVYCVPLSDNPLFLSVTPNADSLVFIDDKPAGAFNMFHNKLRVDADDKEHTVYVEAYSGHPCGGCGPHDDVSIFINTGGINLPAFPNTFDGGCLLERRQAVHSLFYDIRALYETAKIADPNSLRKAKILKELSEALSFISLNTNNNELDEQASVAARHLAPLLALKNSPTTPAVHLIGHAHIDHAWLWPIAETERKTARTFANMLRFIKEYPEFIFIQSQPCQLEIIKNEYPDVFAGIKEAYKNGNWEPNGGMWVEADCNVTSGESLIRQFLVGKQVNKELLGHEADTLWLPDVFGYAAALPQILVGCRIKYFVTSKINWNDTTRFPYETFIWRGIDGTGIKTHFLSTLGPGGGYNGRVVPEEIAAVWNSVQHKEVQSACVKSIGEGDGGGGTLRADLEMARRLGDLEGVPRTAWKTVSAALTGIFSSGDFPEWRGELYLELHRGTYTTQSRTKCNNRRLEFALRNAEFLCVFATLEGRGKYPHKELLDCWKGTLTNQFHDIIPGSSIGRVYSEAEADSQRMLAQLVDLSKDAKSRLVGLCDKENVSGVKEKVFLFNDLSWEYRSPVSIPVSYIGYPDTPENVSPMMLVYDENTVSPVQFYVDFDKHNKMVFSPRIPSLGWVNYAIVSGTGSLSRFIWQDDVLETPFYKIAFDSAGRITSLFGKRSNRETVAPGGTFNAFISAEDIPVFWDAWDIDADWVNHIEQETRLVSTELISIGSEMFCLRRVYKIGKTSCLIQDMMCYSSNPRIDFVTKVDWHERHRLLKVEFDTAISTTQVRCEVQYGHIWRNTHRNLMQDRAKFEICAHKWISLEEEGIGIALLNDCKYGHDVEGGRMRLSLLRSPVAPDPEADQGEHRFTYSLLPFAGAFGSSGVINSAYELNSPVGVLVSNTDASLPLVNSLCTVDGNAVIIESVKAPSGYCQQADESAGSKELVLRLYESLGGSCRTTVRFSRDLTAAAETDLLEENPRPLPVPGRNLCLEFRPFEIKTLRVCF
jgi:alpha-mannosidase